MPNKYKKSVRRETKEIINLLLNNKKIKNDLEEKNEKEDFSAGEINEIDSIASVSANNQYLGNSITSSSETEPISDNKYNIENLFSVRDELGKWAVKHLISNSALNELLAILRKIEPCLPKDARALKKTPRDAPIVALAGGEYVHYGLKKEKVKIKSVIMPAYPFKELKVFLDFEKKLQENEEIFASFENELKVVAKSPNFIKNCWRKILIDELGEQLCWKGTETKKSVRNLSTTKAIRNAALSIGITEDQVFKDSKTFFQFAKNRIKLRKEYNNKKKT